MSKKDENGRILIPSDIVEQCVFLNDASFEKYKLIFFINNLGEVGVEADLGKDLLSFPKDYKFIGICEYDRKTHLLTIPENVDAALGNGDEYFFATPIEGRTILYIYKKESTFQKLNSLLSNVENLLEGIEAYIQEGIEG